MKYKKLNTSDVDTYNNSIIPEDGSIVLNGERDLKIGDGVTQGGKHLVKRAQDVTFDGSTISTANSDQNLTITTNGSGNIYIGADRNMIFDMNAWTGKGILIQDTQEDGYDDSGIPSTLKVGSIYHETGRMVIESDGRILDASGVVVDNNGNPSENPVYGGLWLTNGQDTGFLIPAQTGTIGAIENPNIEIRNNEKIWEFTQTGNINLPENGNISLYNSSTLSQGTFDNMTGGNSGISLTCGIGYELNWQGGHLKNTADNGISSSNIMCDSAIEFSGAGSDNVQIDNVGLTFSDGTTQVTAATGIVADAFNTALVAGTGISLDYADSTLTINSDGTASVIKTNVFNETGNVIPKFNVVYINGGHGDHPTVALAISSGEMTSSKTYGITAENIDHMSIGSVVVMGALTGLDTDQFNPSAPMGDVNGVSLWLSPTTPGGVTTTKPSAPNHAVYVGTIVRTHQNEGVVEVRIQNGYELDELHNVAISGVADGEILVYNSGASLWENTTLSSSLISDFNSSVSGLIPVTNVVGSGNIVASGVAGSFTVSSSGLVKSDTTGITGATAVLNIVQISQADYNNISVPDPNTLYVIND